MKRLTILPIMFMGVALMITSPASAEGLIRGQIDNTMNNIQSMFGDQSIEHEVRSLSDRIQLLDTEQRKMLGILEAKRQERENAAMALQNLGVTPPPPVIQGPVEVPVEGAETTQTCLTSLNQAPIVCW